MSSRAFLRRRRRLGTPANYDSSGVAIVQCGAVHPAGARNADRAWVPLTTWAALMKVWVRWVTWEHTMVWVPWVAWEHERHGRCGRPWVRCVAWEYGRHGRYGRPWQIDHADSAIPPGVSPASLPFLLHSPAVRSYWRTNPASLSMQPFHTCFHCTSCSCPADL